MKTENKYNYGKCHVCEGHIQEKMISQDFWINGRLIIIENVPVGVCTQCGEKIVRSDVGLRINELLSDKESVKNAKKITVPSIEY